MRQVRPALITPSPFPIYINCRVKNKIRLYPGKYNPFIYLSQVFVLPDSPFQLG